MPGRVLAAIHGGDLEDKIVDEACQIALDQGDDLIVTHVVDESFLASLPTSAHLPESSVKTFENIGRRMLSNQKERAEDKDVSCRTAMRRGDLLTELAELIREYEIGTLVVGEHKHSWLENEHGHDWGQLQDETGVRVVVVS